MEVKLENTFVIRTDDKGFEQTLMEFLTNHSYNKKVNAAYFNLNKVGPKK